MNCEFEATPKGCRCVRCGRTVKRHSGHNLIAECKTAGLGDHIASTIKTAARLLHIERWVKETPGCGCKKRREAMNKFGRWWKSAK